MPFGFDTLYLVPSAPNLQWRLWVQEQSLELQYGDLFTLEIISLEWSWRRQWSGAGIGGLTLAGILHLLAVTPNSTSPLIRLFDYLYSRVV